jgi:hypothetical protein
MRCAEKNTSMARRQREVLNTSVLKKTTVVMKKPVPPQEMPSGHPSNRSCRGCLRGKWTGGRTLYLYFTTALYTILARGRKRITAGAGHWGADDRMTAGSGRAMTADITFMHLWFLGESFLTTLDRRYTQGKGASDIALLL